MDDETNGLEELSQIHFDVLNLLEKRLTSKQIALELDVSPATAALDRCHLGRVLFCSSTHLFPPDWFFKETGGS